MSIAMKKQIELWGYQVKCAENFQNIISEFTEFDPQLVLLDIMLPFYNGYHWCSEIRKISKVPIMFISSASDNMNIVMAMNMGGDDFIAKPFDLNVLTAKIQAILRRTYDFSGNISVLEHKGAILNLNDMTLTFKNNKLELTKNEFRILQMLMENKGKTVSRNSLMVRLWESDIYVEENTLSVNINRLRKKLDSIGLNDFIRTKSGSGYIIGS
ncbi:MAG: response regulator transcription factor [Ruminococcus sp.]|nr:response regulator transcription factor [Ruminococcus sp.]